MGLDGISIGWTLLPFFSVIGILLNIIGFRRGARSGCSGLGIGAVGFVTTATGSWVLGVAALVGLGLMAFRPESKAAKEAREARANQAFQTSGQATTNSSQVTTDATAFRATYSDDDELAPSTSVAPIVDPAASAQEMPQKSVGNLEDTVEQIEDDFVAGRIDRDTYVMRRRALLG